MTQIVPDPNTDMIELEDSEENVYDNFLESMRSSETKRMYVRNLKMFLNLIPNNILKEEDLEESNKKLQTMWDGWKYVMRLFQKIRIISF